MANIEVRPAKPEDRDAVLAFCVQTWEWGDYIEYVWEEWLHDPQGLLLVATLDGRPVGVSHLRMLNATDAWFEGMRVDPHYRKHGLATILNNGMLEAALQRGATNARLVTESTNTASISLIERGFFRRVGSFAQHRATPDATATLLESPDTPQLATEADIDDIVDYLNASNNFPLSGGFYYYGFTAYLLSTDVIAEKVAAGHVYILRRWQRLDGLVIAEPRHGRQGSQLSLGYIDGTTESISLLAYTLRQQLPQLGLESVSAYVPDLIMVRDAFIGASYEWDGKVFYTYERRLT